MGAVPGVPRSFL